MGLEVAVVSYYAAVSYVNPVGDVAPFTYPAFADIVPTPNIGAFAYHGFRVDVIPFTFNLYFVTPPLFHHPSIVDTVALFPLQLL